MSWIEPKIAIRYLKRKIKNGQLPPNVIQKNGQTAQSKKEALQWLQECQDNGITAI